MTNLYMRNTQAIIGELKIDADDLTVYFDVPYDDGPDVNVAEIDIFNLSTATIATMKKGQKVILNAGYQKDVGAILVGVLQRVQSEWRGVDKITQLTIFDTNDQWMTKTVKKTYKEGITGKQILADLLPKTGLKVAAFKLPFNMKYDGAKTIDGGIGKIIVEVAADCNAKIHVNKGKIYIREKAEGDAIGFVLDKEHGLIGSPTPIEYEQKYKVIQKKKTIVTVKPKKGSPKGTKSTKATKYVDEYVTKTKIRRGYKVISLLNHSFATDVILQIKSQTCNGVFRIEKGKHVSNGGSYYTEMEVYPK
jgi:hypothetical protein